MNDIADRFISQRGDQQSGIQHIAMNKHGFNAGHIANNTDYTNITVTEIVIDDDPVTGFYGGYGKVAADISGTTG